jgi:hypothetical protein
MNVNWPAGLVLATRSEKLVMRLDAGILPAHAWPVLPPLPPAPPPPVVAVPAVGVPPAAVPATGAPPEAVPAVVPPVLVPAVLPLTGSSLLHAAKALTASAARPIP